MPGVCGCVITRNDYCRNNQLLVRVFHLHISNYTEEVILEYLVQPQGKHYLREKLHHRPPEQVVS